MFISYLVQLSKLLKLLYAFQDNNLALMKVVLSPEKIRIN